MEVPRSLASSGGDGPWESLLCSKKRQSPTAGLEDQRNQVSGVTRTLPVLTRGLHHHDEHKHVYRITAVGAGDRDIDKCLVSASLMTTKSKRASSTQWETARRAAVCSIVEGNACQVRVANAIVTTQTSSTNFTHLAHVIHECVASGSVKALTAVGSREGNGRTPKRRTPTQELKGFRRGSTGTLSEHRPRVSVKHTIRLPRVHTIENSCWQGRGGVVQGIGEGVVMHFKPANCRDIQRVLHRIQGGDRGSMESGVWPETQGPVSNDVVPMFCHSWKDQRGAKHMLRERGSCG